MANDRKWRIEWNESRDVELPSKLEPLGYVRGITADKAHSAVTKAAENTNELKSKRAMDLARAPFRSLLQTGFMMWMSGSSINIFSIMITGMIIMNTIKSFFAINSTFTSVDDGTVDLTQPKLTFLAGNLVNMGVALYKCGNMGLLPTTAADWTWLLPVKQAVESSAYAWSS